jgi:hypothetical protein
VVLSLRSSENNPQIPQISQIKNLRHLCHLWIFMGGVELALMSSPQELAASPVVRGRGLMVGVVWALNVL